MKMKLAVALAMGTALTVCAPVSAATVFNVGNGNNGLYSSKQWTVDGISVTATAWSSATTTATPIQNILGWYDVGLGVTSAGDSTTPNGHTVDNLGRYDFVALSFSKPVEMLSATLVPFNVNGGSSFNTDADAWISYAAGVSFGAPSGATWSTLLGNGKNIGTSGNTLPGLTQTIKTAGGLGNLWVIGAAHSTSDRDDGFKLSSFAVNTVAPAVPEPATWATMMLGLGVVGGALRRQRRPQASLATA